MSNSIEVSVEDLANLDALPVGIEQVVDPAALEAQLVQEEQERLNKPANDEEIACMMLKLYTPKFNQLVDKLSNRELKRVIKALVEFPLGKSYKHIGKEEKEAFAIGQGLMDAKMLLMVKTYYENKDQIIEMAAEAAKSATFEFGEQATEQKEVIENGKT